MRDGFDILVHCKGGIGRAGMIAARLMVEMSAKPDEAIVAVRAARPGAIETRAQEAHVRRTTALGEAVPETTADAIMDRAKGCLLGHAIGDAIGTTVEFRSRDSFEPLVGISGGGPFKLKPGQWTDDTAMALALADSLIACDGVNERDLMDRFVSWCSNGADSRTGACFDIGITTRQALSRYLSTDDPVAEVRHLTAGNGSLMRLAPVGLWSLRHSEEETRNAARRQSATTHAAPQALAACEAYALMLRAAIGGASQSRVMMPVVIGEATIDAITSGSWRGKPRAAIPSSEYVAYSLKAALWCVGRTGTFEDAVLLAANLGDDADTTAATTGQLAGALYGASLIPTDWLKVIAWRRKIENAATSLAGADH